jgi:ubiquinone/menaquinone biosynthesis C-methylase UbiE
MNTEAAKNNFKINDWDQYARHYNVLNELIPYREMLKKVCENLTVAKGQIILDAACGTGNLEFMAGTILPNAGINFIGVDFSKEMIKVAQENNDKKQADFIWSDLNRPLKFGNACFDQVVTINSIYSLDIPLMTIAEFYRVLRPGGQMILVTPKQGYQNGLILKEHCGDTGPDEPWLNAHVSEEKEYSLLNRAVKDRNLAEKFWAIAEFNRRISQNCLFHFYSQEEIRTLLKSSGFNNFDIDFTYAGQNLFIKANKEA